MRLTEDDWELSLEATWSSKCSNLCVSNLSNDSYEPLFSEPPRLKFHPFWLQVPKWLLVSQQTLGSQGNCISHSLFSIFRILWWYFQIYRFYGRRPESAPQMFCFILYFKQHDLQFTVVIKMIIIWMNNNNKSDSCLIKNHDMKIELENDHL